MNIQRRQLLRTAASCFAATSLLASVPALQAADPVKVTMSSVAASGIPNAKWIAQRLTERLAGEGITVQVFVLDTGISDISAETLAAKNVHDTSISAAAEFHLGILPTLLAKGAPKPLGSKYSLATLNYATVSDTDPSQEVVDQLTAIPLEYASKGKIPFGSNFDYRSIPTLLDGKTDVSVGTKFELATALATLVDDGKTLAINGIPLKAQSLEVAIDVLTAWHASTDPWSDPINPRLGDSYDCHFTANDLSECSSESSKHSTSYEDLGKWYKGRDIGRQPTEFWQWRKMM